MGGRSTRLSTQVKGFGPLTQRAGHRRTGIIEAFEISLGITPFPSRFCGQTKGLSRTLTGVTRLGDLQWDRLGQNLIAEVRRQALLRKHVYGDAERFLQILLERDEVKKVSTLRHIDEQIEVAGAARFAAGDRAEHADIPR